MGAAIDALGREIIISSPVTLKLSMMDGFTNNEYAKNVYLCIAYDEKGKEPVHSVANAAVRSDEISEYNRVLESYRLFIREDAPDPSSFPLDNVMEQTSVLYQDSQVRILQTTPRYVNPGQLFEMTLRVEKTLQAAKVSFQYEVIGDQVEAESYGALTFNEPQDRQETEYEIKVLLRAGRSSKGKSRVGVKRDTAVLRIGDKQVPIAASSMNELNIINTAVKEQWLDDYVNRSLEDSLESSSEPCIYLAKINLLQMGPTYIIEKVEPVPFGEYVYNATALHKLGHNERGASSATALPIAAKSSITSIGSGQKPELHVDFNRESSELSFNLGLPDAQSNDAMRTGVVDIPVSSLNKFTVSPFGKGGKSYVSDEIEHGLGNGNTYIVAGVEEVSDDYISDILSNSERVYYGASDVFKGSEFEQAGPEVKIGTLVYPRKGTFRIGVRLLQPTEATNIRIRWWAYNKPAEAVEAASAVEHSVLEAASGKEE
jgi:hypothetical protein